ncbi:hypothetical protein [Yinghuangia soli]|uniref:Uncharacterized protein n=1 Tax=Yinghuangia soli TaxID=2908204 RepID=A0AA41PYV9_9ACTN|nr:hypothetical protein [Yinghuangia soli]MCF2528206.1 hypothetical protein [Yinghuangia soli]
MLIAVAALPLAIGGCSSASSAGSAAATRTAGTPVESAEFAVVALDSEEVPSPNRDVLQAIKGMLPSAADWGPRFAGGDTEDVDDVQTVRYDASCRAVGLAMPKDTPASLTRNLWAHYDKDAPGYGPFAMVSVGVYANEAAARASAGFVADALRRCPVQYYDDEVQYERIEAIALPAGTDAGFVEVAAERGDYNYTGESSGVARYAAVTARQGKVVVSVYVSSGSEETWSEPDTSRIDEALKAQLVDGFTLMAARLPQAGI